MRKRNTYPGSMSIDEKNIYHAKGLGIDPEAYGITQMLPPIELIRAYQIRIKVICNDPSTIKNEKATYTDVNGITPATVFLNKEGSNLISFNQTTNNRGDKQRPGYLAEYLKTGKIGKKR